MKIPKNPERLVCLILGILFLQISYSQENYLPGYIVTLEGDTIKGTIDYRNWERNPGTIKFQSQTGSEKKSYNPLDIRLFGVKDEIYVSAIAETETTSRTIKKLQFDSKLNIKIDTLFLQTMVQGAKSLYYYKDAFGIDNFYIKIDGEFQLLFYKKYLVERNKLRENTKYIGQLAFYFNDCASIKSKLKHTNYEKKSLEQLFNHYYNCIQTEPEFQKRREKILAKFGLLAGGTLSMLKFEGITANIELINTDYSRSCNYTAALFLELVLPRNQRKWSINNELIYTSYIFDGYYNEFYSEDVYTKTYTELGYAYLKLNNMLRFKYPIGGMFIYLNAGFSINEINYKKTDTKSYSIEYTREGKSINETRKYEQGYIFGLGTKFKKFSFEMRYERGNGMSALDTFKSRTKRYYFLLGYTF